MADRKFYDWFEDQQDLAERCGVSLGQVQADLMEAAWDASRQAIEIELPFLYPFYRQEVIAVLEAAGLKVKPC